ncbi:MAG: histidine phosphatase family protein [Desulfobacter sp.]|nr:histidine phosphatase family protein [Desulfobacter sp.]WDP86672.1 MAG: histidine phosphatase family protein [Desulfobacter sp.]
MERKYPVRSQQTIDTLTALLDRGVKKMSVILRHSDRYYPKDARMEPFMGLTDPGKSYALDLGRALPDHITPQLFSSHFGRCIETAYLIDKGFTLSHGSLLDHVITQDTLAPFYINDIEQALGLMQDCGSQQFIRNWFDNTIDQTIMEPPEKTADILTAYMIQRLSELETGQVAFCVSHDWNIFPIKEFKLGLAHEGAGDVGYLDGVIFFEENGQVYAETFQTDPVAIKTL